MKRFYRFLAVLLCCTALSSCHYAAADFYKISDLPSEAAPPTPVVDNNAGPLSTVLCLSYNENDSINPYLTKTATNLNLSRLLFDPLVRLDASYRPENILAQQIDLQGTECVVTLKDNLRFSDGSPLTAEDVIYSLTLASGSQSVYHTRFSNIERFEKRDDKTIVITLREPDIYFVNLLDFPVIKKNDPSSMTLIGSGRYVMNKAGNTATLTESNTYLDRLSLDTIRLLSLPDKDAYLYALKLGNISYYFDDLSDNNNINVGTGTSLIQLNTMVYLGINQYRSNLSNKYLRQAILYTLDRAELAKVAYSGKAIEAAAPFNPVFYGAASLPGHAAPNLPKANELLDGVGLDVKNQSGERIYKNAGMKLRLLVNFENGYRTAAAAQIAQQLQTVGIEVEVVQKSFEDYSAALQAGDYDLYIGEIKLENNMDLSNFFKPSNISQGIVVSDDFKQSFVQFKSGALGIADFCILFNDQAPFVPLVFRKGMVSFVRNLENNITATENDIFYNINEWHFFD